MKHTHSFNLASWEQMNALHKLAYSHLNLKEFEDFYTEATSSKFTIHVKESEKTQELINALSIHDLKQLFIFSYEYKRTYMGGRGYLEDWALYRVLEGIDYTPSKRYYSSLSEESLNSINHREALKELEFSGCDCDAEECDFLTLNGLILTSGPCYEKVAREIEHALHMHPLLNEEDYMYCMQCEEGFDIQESEHSSSCFCSGWCEDEHKEKHVTQCELCEQEALKEEGANADFFYDVERYIISNYCNKCDELLKALYYVGDSQEPITGEDLIDLNDDFEIERLAEAQEKGASHSFNSESIYNVSYVRPDQDKLL